MKEMNMKMALHVFADKSYSSFIFCHKHLPVVLAHFIMQLDNLPAGLSAMPSVIKVRGIILNSFLKIVSCKIPTSPEAEKEFIHVLEDIDEAHAEAELVKTLSVGILELKDHLSRHRRALLELKESSPQWSRIKLNESDIMPYEELAGIQEPLDFCNRCIVRYNFMSRMLLNLGNDAKRVGMVDLEVNLERIVRGAVDEARQICTDHYGDCPDVEFTISTDTKKIRFPFMTTTIRYIVVELMKNAFRATVDAHMKRNSCGIVTCDDMPPVKILVHMKKGINHACIRVSDEGLGMTQKQQEMAMAYSFTTVDKPAISLTNEGHVEHTEAVSPLAGYGYGLPMSRVYANCFGGDLAIKSMEGFGTRAYYHIQL
ncbi:pyruvate dehydrogenase kinase [Strigomonas culicis]|nr:pyruvate dehydrogenase kinase [Strigomonas culicis]|eukprot:EPY31056.1 pyruvate dehydrogenase kinase [Strigomonas culicis]